MSSAKRVVDSTIRRLLRYTAEIIISIILLILISLPLVFTVPMWVQEIVFDVPSSELLVNPIAWFGADATFGITLGLGIFSFIIGYLFLSKMLPSSKSKEEPTQVTEESDEEEEEEIAEVEETEEVEAEVEPTDLPEEEIEPTPEESDTE